MIAVLYGDEIEKELWRVGENGAEKISDDLHSASVRIAEEEDAVYFGTNPRRIARDILDAGYVPVDLHRWRADAGTARLAANVMAGYHQVCATGEFMWVWKSIDEELVNCGTVSLIDLRAVELGTFLPLGNVCQYADDDVLAAFTGDCRNVVAAQPDLRIWSVEDPGVETSFDIEPNSHRLAPDARHVGFEPIDAPGTLRFIRTLDGTSLLDRSPALAPPLAYSPDGQFVVYEVPRATERPSHLEVFRFGSETPIEIDIEAERVWPYDLLFSPDDRALAFVRRVAQPEQEIIRTELLLANLSDGSVQTVDQAVFNDQMLGAWRKNFVWRPELYFSADGHYLTFFVAEPPYDPEVGVEIRVWNRDSGFVRTVGEGVAVTKSVSWAPYHAHAAVSPDGRHAAWLSVDGELFLSHVMDGTGKRIAAAPVQDFALSNNELAWIFHGGTLHRMPLVP